LKSGQWLILFLANIVLLAAILIKNSTTLYYVNNVLSRPDLATALMVTTLVFAIGGAVVCAPLFNRFEKSKAYSFLIFLTGILSISLYFVDAKNITAIFILTAAYGFVQMATSPLIWSMLADLADYESIRAGRTLNGVVFSTILFAIKAGIAIGGAAVGWMLALVDYMPGIGLQTFLVNNTISLMYTVVPGIIMFLVALILIPYKLDKKKIAGQVNNSQNIITE